MLILVLALCLVNSAHAFIGMGIKRYDPTCAYACRNVIGNVGLDCTTSAENLSQNQSRTATVKRATKVTVTSKCRASSAPFLTTLALCAHDRCYPEFNPSRAMVETWWYKYATGDADVEPMWGWQEAYDRIKGTPNVTYDAKSMDMINSTVKLKVADWQTAKQTIEEIEWQNSLHARYGLTLLLLGAGLPILFTAATYLPYGHQLALWLKPRFIYPALLPFRPRHIQPFFKIFHAPTLGHGLYLALFIVMTIVLSAVEFKSIQPNTSYASTRLEIMTYVSYRAATLSMALLPLAILFAGRNNLLLWVTNWSHSTYLLLHRWIARLCLIEMIIHSVLETVTYVENGKFAASVVKDWWAWGCVATIACSMLVLSAQFRKYYYEIFLISHIILAVFVIVGIWYHVEILFQRRWGYQNWIYICCAIWFFDRVIRLGRVLKVGLKTATITSIGSEVVRVDIPGIRWSTVPGQHAYLYLPGVKKWAPWENHPFSVIPTVLLNKPKQSCSVPESETSSSRSLRSPVDTPDLEKSIKDLTPTTPYRDATGRLDTTGVTLFVKRRYGFTRSLPAAVANQSLNYTALLDGPYTNSSSRPTLATDRLILIAGGIGITGVLPFVHAHPNAKLYWSVRDSQRELVDVLRPAIGDTECSIRVAQRNDVKLALREEVKAGWGYVGVVVCGPGVMCDEVRKCVVELGRVHPTKWELDVEAFV